MHDNRLVINLLYSAQPKSGQNVGKHFVSFHVLPVSHFRHIQESVFVLTKIVLLIVKRNIV